MTKSGFKLWILSPNELINGETTAAKDIVRVPDSEHKAIATKADTQMQALPFVIDDMAALWTEQTGLNKEVCVQRLNAILHAPQQEALTEAGFASTGDENNRPTYVIATTQDSQLSGFLVGDAEQAGGNIHVVSANDDLDFKRLLVSFCQNIIDKNAFAAENLPISIALSANDSAMQHIISACGFSAAEQATQEKQDIAYTGNAATIIEATYPGLFLEAYNQAAGR